MSELKLIEPTLILKDEYLDMIQDWKNHHEKPKPWTINIENENIPLLIEKLEGFKKGIGLKEHQVENTTYWLVKGNKVIGAVNIRHRLNDYLYKFDGHIGGGIRPTERNKGYGTIMLELALQKAKEMGLEQILITCNQGNIASERSIIKNRGIFESVEMEESGNWVKRFWINLNR